MHMPSTVSVPYVSNSLNRIYVSECTTGSSNCTWSPVQSFQESEVHYVGAVGKVCISHETVLTHIII